MNLLKQSLPWLGIYRAWGEDLLWVISIFTFHSGDCLKNEKSCNKTYDEKVHITSDEFHYLSALKFISQKSPMKVSMKICKNELIYEGGG